MTSYWNTNRQSTTLPTIKVFGPGDRPSLARIFPAGRPAPAVVNPENPMPGITSMTGYLEQAFATDINDRMRDNNQPSLSRIFELHDIDVSRWWAIDPEGVPPVLPAGTRIPVVVDGDVTVTATLANHHPAAAAFAYRFDTPDGSIVISGDTTVHPNVEDLARGADYLVHEVIDAAWVDRVTAALPDAVREGTRKHLIEAHTTIEQVGRVAERAKVKNLVLTHLVPADNPTRLWRRAGRNFSGRTYVGEDLARFGMGPRT